MEKFNNDYFKKHQCDVCKAPASFYRYSSKLKKGFMLCNSEKCNYSSDVNVGWVNLNIAILEKNG